MALLRKMTKDEVIARIREIKGTSVLFGDQVLWDKLRLEMQSLKERLDILSFEEGVYLTAAPSKDKDGWGYFKGEGVPTWYSGADYGKLRRFLPREYREDGAYGIHEWLKSIGALTENTYEDHEYGMVCYYFKSKQDAVDHVDLINKTLSKLHEQGEF